MINKAVFVVGSGRCGTSWLQHWLLQNPQVFGVYNETNLFYYISTIAKFEPKKVVKNNRSTGICHVNEWISSTKLEKMLSDLVYEIFNNTTDKGNRTCLVEKSPKHIWDIELINTLFDYYCKVFFIHIYRDGRNVVESFLRQGWHSNTNYVVDEWIQIMNLMLDNQFPENVLHIRYEDLVQNPSLSSNITSFCNIEHHFNIEPFKEICGPNGILEFNPQRYKYLERYEKIAPLFKQMEPTLVRLGYPI